VVVIARWLNLKLPNVVSNSRMILPFVCLFACFFICVVVCVCVFVIAWRLDLKLPVQSVYITTNIVSSIRAHVEVYSIQHYVIKFVSDLRQVVVLSVIC
jgi:hypothetical protein